MGTTDGVPAIPDAALPDLLLRAIDAMSQGITVAENSPGRRLVYANKAFVRLTGYPLQEILGRSGDFLLGPDSSVKEIEAIRDALDNGRDITSVITAYRRDGTAFSNELSISAVRGTGGEITHFIATQRDVTGSVDRERELTRLAHTDALTGLTNQRHLQQELDDLLPPAAGENLAVIVTDLDRFHHINEDFDFQTGDRVLAGVADRLSSVAAPGDIIGRLTGDQFAIVRRGSTTTCQTSAQQLVDDIHGALRAPIETPEIAIPVRVNCGIAVAPADGATAETLIAAGRSRVDLHHPPARARAPQVQQ